MKDTSKLISSWNQFKDRTLSGRKPDASAAVQSRIERARKDYNYFVQYYFAHYTESQDGKAIDNAKFHNDLAEKFKANDRLFTIVEWARGLAKSTHLTIFIPLWLKIQEVKTINTMVLVSVNETAAIKLLQAIQAELEYNERFISDFGQQKSSGDWSEGAFITSDNTAFFALGMGQSPRGLRNQSNRPDFIVCDDLDTEKMCRNQSRVHEVVQWIYRALIPTMDIGYQRFALVNNRIDKDSILAHVVSDKPDWHHSKVNALDEKGNPTWKSKYTKAYYKQLRKDIGDAAFLTEYMNDPHKEATDFKESWIKFKKMDWRNYRRIVAYIDPSFSTSDRSDHTAIKFWAKDGKEYHCLKAYNRQRESLAKALVWLTNFMDRLEQTIKVKVKVYIEANATQAYLINDALDKAFDSTAKPLSLRLDKDKKGDKADRIASMIPAYEMGNVFYSEAEKDDQDLKKSIDHLIAWSEDSNTPDDSPDADQSAWVKLDKNSSPIKFKQGNYVKNDNR